MRTTLQLDDRLVREAKALAAESGRTLTSLVEDGLREMLARRAHRPTVTDVELPIGGPGWVRRGVDINDSASLLEEMEGRE